MISECVTYRAGDIETTKHKTRESCLYRYEFSYGYRSVLSNYN